MIAYVYVEGESDRLALEALWKTWRDQLRQSGDGIRVLPLDDKARFFRKIGAHTAARLLANADDIIVGLPDLYPTAPYANGPYAHTNLAELNAVQKREVRRALEAHVSSAEATTHLNRFMGSALKHDLEMLLLAAEQQLANFLRVPTNLGTWRQPVEDQNYARPPKRVVEEIFRSRSSNKMSYRDTVHASAVLSRVMDIREIFFTQAGQLKCPEFKRMVDWMGTAFGTPGYQNPAE
ncbi:MAG: hypothetical protein JWN40_519 [Phycisphaerales bacterium]|nr:hypothetical protein [Phycisphaerales bacterium]